MNKQIRKAIIPAAGLGTRFLPATKAQPKEMLLFIQMLYYNYLMKKQFMLIILKERDMMLEISLDI